MKQNLLTTKQAADYLGISRSTLYRREKEHTLMPDKRDKITGYRYYTRETLAQYRQMRFTERKTPPRIKLPYPFTFIDLFAGIGGLRIAFERAGGTCVFSSKIDKFSCSTYSHIFGETPAGDITKIAATDIPNFHILLAGFPCQPFSLAGVSKNQSLGRSHGFKDEIRGTLFFDIVRILEHHRPQAFLLENIKNLRSHDRGRTWKTIMHTLKALGYTVYSKVLNARLLVPQHRERVFIVGFREPVYFAFPFIQDRKPRLRDILDDNVDDKYTLSDRLWTYLQEYAEKHRQRGNGFGYGLADLDGVSRTLSARYHKDGAEILIPQNNKNPRRLTPAECARLQGFPSKYEGIVVSDTQAYKQFGNAVSVPLASIIADEIIQALASYKANRETAGST